MGMISLREALVNGLRNDSRVQRNAPCCSGYYGMKPLPFGARVASVPTQRWTLAELTAEGMPYSWPFPQVFYGRSACLALGETYLKTVDVGTWAASAVSLYNPLTGAADTVGAGGGVWHFADMGDTYYLFNGATVLFKSGWIDATKTYVWDTSTIATGCNFRHRLLLGGFSGTLFSATWTALMDALVAYGLGDFEFSFGQPQSNWVWWSSVTGGDHLFWMVPDIAQNGLEDADIRALSPYGATKPYFMEVAKRAVSAFVEMPWRGDVLCLKALRNAVVVYGSGGVTALVPLTIGDVPTFGIRELLPVGVHSRGAVGGDERHHIFVDVTGMMWRLDEQLQLQRLGYQEYGAVLTGDVVIQYDAVNREFYLGDGTYSYVLTESGLAEFGAALTSVFYHSGTLYSVSSRFEADVECVSNGTFTGNANGWTLGEDMSYGANKVSFADAVSFMYQSNEDQAVPIQDGHKYAVTYTYEITNPDGDNYVQLGLGDNEGAPQVAGGPVTVEEEIVADGTVSHISFSMDGVVDGWVDSISVKEIMNMDIVSEVFDGGSREAKTIKRIDLAATDTTGLMVAVDYRYSKAEAFTRTDYVSADDRGQVFLQVSGVEFRVAVFGDDAEEVVLDDILVHFEEGEKQGLKKRLEA